MSLGLGLGVMLWLSWYLRKFENLFLTPSSIQSALYVVVFGFFLSGLYAAHKSRKQGDRRQKAVSAYWIMEGNRYEDIHYKILLNAVSDTIFEVDEHGKIIFLNANYTQLTDIPVGDSIGQSLFDMIHPAQKEENVKRFKRFLAKKLKPYRVVLNLKIYDGSYRTVEFGFRILSKSKDDRIHAIGTIVDRESQRQDRAAAKEAEKKFRDIFENAVSGIFQTTADGKFVSVNPALARILGYDSVHEVLNSVHSISSQVYVRPEDRTRFKAEMDRDGNVDGFETQMYKKDGTKIWVVESARAVRNQAGDILYYEGSLWDITERHKAQQALESAKLAAEMSSRTKTEFLANMSHELRTPLNAIIGFSEILKDEIMGPLGNDEYKEYATDIYTSGNSLLRIISEILEVSKIEAGNRELNEGPVKISRAVEACLVILQSKIDDLGLNVTLDLPETLPELIGEELVIKQILLNLVSNAVKFTPENGQITVKSFIDSQNGEMVVQVIDTGIGMSPENVKKAIQPFWQENSSLARDISGTGLGLTLVQSLTGLHGARLELTSEKGKGTTASVTFPKERIIPKTQSPQG